MAKQKKRTDLSRVDAVLAGIAKRNQKLKPIIDTFVEEDGTRYIQASKLGELLEYDSFNTFKRCVERAQITAGNSDVPIDINFVETDLFDGKGDDILLTEWAAYATILEADTRKPMVALAKSFFATLAHDRAKVDEDRLKERHIFKTLHKRLHRAAEGSGIRQSQHAIFDDHGYRGFYGMSIADVEKYKGVPQNEALVDHADHTELAANNLRMSLAADRLENGVVRTPRQANDAFFDVSQIVRKAVIEANNTKPENLPLAPESINELSSRKKKELKSLKS